MPTIENKCPKLTLEIRNRYGKAASHCYNAHAIISALIINGDDRFSDEIRELVEAAFFATDRAYGALNTVITRLHEIKEASNKEWE